MTKMKTIKLENNLNDLSEACTISQLQDVNTDLILMICGQKIGSGSYRSVYDFNMNDNMVVKLEPNNTDCNITEYMLWDEIRGLTGRLAWVKDWFAPIHYCSPNGKVLIMEKTMRSSKKMPTKVPAFFSDVKEDNFGWIGNKFVCHDYGFIHKFIDYKNKFQNVKW